MPIGAGLAAKHPWYRPRCYLHFDPPVGLKHAQKIATNPKKVAQHAFYPLIAYQVESKKLKHDKASGELIKKSKTRPIRYAAHLDSHIYSYYAWQLSQLYERLLHEKDLGDVILAFRSLGKSNIDFAAAAFNEIANRGNCSAVALDITGFFDNIDHEVLKAEWARLLGTARLPEDHFCIYESLTKYSFVNKKALYNKLGISLHNPRTNGRKRLCEPHEFRTKIRDEGLIEKNPNNFGIPQGTPISALLSNIYMTGFDWAANKAAEKAGGKYFRYCDDMLFIVPTKRKKRVAEFARKNIKKLKLDINVSKTELRDFKVKKGIITSDKPLQYLGFTYDGERILIRSSALARYSEKMKRGVCLAKATMKKKNKLKSGRGDSPKYLFRRKIYIRYSHLGTRNFIRYGFNAAKTMNSKAIKKQLRPLWDRLIEEIEA